MVKHSGKADPLPSYQKPENLSLGNLARVPVTWFMSPTGNIHDTSAMKQKMNQEGAHDFCFAVVLLKTDFDSFHSVRQKYFIKKTLSGLFLKLQRTEYLSDCGSISEAMS